MLTFEKFSGINNVLPSQRLSPSELRVATNVDIGLSGEVRRRQGYSQVHANCHKNVHQADGFMLATVEGALTAIWPNNSRTVLHPAFGTKRVWYCNLPDGRTVLTNGNIRAVTDGVTMTPWGVPVPESIGELVDVEGELHPGDYQYQITYVRLADGLEGGPEYSNPIPVTRGGVQLLGLPAMNGYAINVYLTSQNGGDGYLAGTTSTSEFTYTGKNADLTLPCRTNFLYNSPKNAVMPVMWRGRVLTAEGSVLHASRPHQFEMFDRRRDFKQFDADITTIVAVDGGVYVGTEKELAFLAGTEFDKLQYIKKVDGAVVRGSGVQVRGELLKQGEGAGLGTAMVCIADSVLVAGFSDGNIIRMTEGRYSTNVTEVWAGFRTVDGIPQYVAVSQ